MAELTPKTISELPTAATLSDGDMIPISSGSTSKKTLWSTIKKYFVRRVKTGNDVYISSNTEAGQFLQVGQVENNVDKGLIVSDTYVGAYDFTNSEWLWRTPAFSEQGSYAVWPVAMGGTGASTAAGAWSSLGGSGGSGYCKLPDGTMFCWGNKSYSFAGKTASQSAGSKFWYIEFAEDVAFPEAFYAKPVLTITKTEGSVTAPVGWVSYTASKITEVDFAFPAEPNLSGSNNATVGWLAIGRWKA